MKKIILLSFILWQLPILLNAQTLAEEVYMIFQENCTTSGCHNNNNPAAELDLQGSGSNGLLQVMLGKLVNIEPSNTYAREAGQKLIVPGRPDKSFLFKKINQGLDMALDLHEDEEANMPKNQDPLTDVEKETIRQWILYGAQFDGMPNVNNVPVTEIIEDYYTNGGDEAFPDGPPPGPAANEGFQFKVGPFFMPPGGEVEYFQKYDLELPEDLEVYRIDHDISSYSHHLLLYGFGQGASGTIKAGFRDDPDHNDVTLITAVQESGDIRLPEGTAFKWKEDLIIDLNPHYINYNPSMPFKAEAYVNVYTQELGTAAQEMKTELFVNGAINIPNNGDLVTYEQVVNFNLGDIYTWLLAGHTHKYGAGYKVYERENGIKGDLFYDGSCPQGTPGCVSPYFDYQHIPSRVYPSFKPITMDFSNGIVHEASWINDGPSTLFFGPTSDDEMMVLIIMYVDDLDGVTVTNTKDVNQVEGVRIYPNPMNEIAKINLPEGFQATALILTDISGKVIRHQNITDSIIQFEKNDLNAGLYFYQLTNDKGNFASGKIVIE